MTTPFALEPMHVDTAKGSFVFWFDGNGKITAGNGTYENPAANAFSLTHIVDCPGATRVCIKECYVNGLQKVQPKVYRAYQHNSLEIRRALILAPGATWKAFAEWAEHHAAKGFRWHVSGDIFSDGYARFIARVAWDAPEVPFVLYTRSFHHVRSLLNIPNLTVNISADASNYNTAQIIANMHGLRLCYLAASELGHVPPTLPPGSIIFPTYHLRGRDLKYPEHQTWWRHLSLEQQKMVCPVDFFGQSPTMRCGPCSKCFGPLRREKT